MHGGVRGIRASAVIDRARRRSYVKIPSKPSLIKPKNAELQHVHNNAADCLAHWERPNNTVVNGCD